VADEAAKSLSGRDCWLVTGDLCGQCCEGRVVGRRDGPTQSGLAWPAPTGGHQVVRRLQQSGCVEVGRCHGLSGGLQPRAALVDGLAHLVGRAEQAVSGARLAYPVACPLPV